MEHFYLSKILNEKEILAHLQLDTKFLEPDGTGSGFLKITMLFFLPNVKTAKYGLSVDYPNKRNEFYKISLVLAG